MCGIFGMFLNRPLSMQDIDSARTVLDSIAHRGRDGQGEWIDQKKGVYLGHQRLSIIDLSHSSDQPLIRDGNAFIYNGELYNFQVLRKELEKQGVSFISDGDGEVLMQGFQHWGNKVFDRVDGMFALAHWDGNKGTIAVDAFGEKPLFIAQTKDGVYFCSEIRPLAKLLGKSPSLSEMGWVSYLSLGFIPQPETFFPGIEMLPPGTWRNIINGQLKQINTYWSPPKAGLKGKHFKPVTEKELDKLVEAVCKGLENRLLTDVPLALFLSAGVDSSLVASLCRFELNKELHCLTLGFKDSTTIRDESETASRIAAHLGFEHQVLENNSDINISRLTELLGQPTGTVGILSLEQISAKARSIGYKVAITGMGGDEVTAGYAKHAYIWRLRWLYRLPWNIRKLLGSVLSKFSSRYGGPASLLLPYDTEVYLAVKNYPALACLRSLPSYKDWLDKGFCSSGKPFEVDIPYYELTKVMPSVHLYTSDHASMRHGLELRTPFLNRKVVETVAEWDARSLVAYGQKSVLRRILSRYLPEELFSQPKTGFSYPRELFTNNVNLGKLPGIHSDISDSIWERRGLGNGWLTIAVRLAVADNFFSDWASSES